MRQKKVSISNQNHERYLRAFLVALIAATIMFLPYIIMGKGVFYFYGDYNAQQIPFNMLAHNAVRSGDVFWNWNTDLGANFIGSYSFYVIGSPFFWLTLPFPNWMVPYLLGPLLILKFAFASFFAYCFIRRFANKPDAALIGGLLYAFSGFSLYNIFFNHFHEAIVFFPLLLYALERLMVDKKRGLFAVAVSICAVSNYFFFIAMAVFLVPYFIIRWISPDWQMTKSKFFSVMLESILGVGLASIIFIPSILAVLQNSRVSDLLVGWDMLVYPRSQLYANVLLSPFLPTDMPSMPLYFPDSGTQWASVSAWLPLFSMVGVIAFLQASKRHWLKRMIVLCIIFALVPILNSSFVMFNTSYYARWFFMPILMMCLATAISIDKSSEVNWWSAFRWTLIITVIAALAIGFLPNVKDANGNITRFGLYGLGDPEYPEEAFYNPIRFFANSGLAVLSLAALGFILPFAKKSPKTFLKMSVTTVTVMSIIAGAFFIGCGKAVDFYAPKTFEGNLIGDVKLDFPIDENYRIDLYEYEDNAGMFWDTPSIQTFHSVVPASIMDFYRFINVPRDVASRPDTTKPAIRSLLSVKYLIDDKSDNNNKDEKFTDESGNPKMQGFEYLKTVGNFDIYENKNFVPIGFAYNQIMSEKTALKFTNNKADYMMLKAIMLSGEDIEKYKNILPEYAAEDTPLFDSLDISSDSEMLRQNAVSSFSRDNKGFEAKITLEKDNLVFFSVPYNSGWSATVDGKKVDILKANKGFMAVPVKGDLNQHTIRFNYMTPGIKIGIIISISSLLILLIYVFLHREYVKRGSGPDAAKYGAAPFKPQTETSLIDIDLIDALSEIGDRTEGNLFDISKTFDNENINKKD